MSNAFVPVNPTFTDLNGAVVTQITNPLRSSVIDAQQASSLVYGGVVDVDTPGATTYASASKVTSSGGSILFTKDAGHGYYTGLIVQFTTGTTLPTNIVALTDYYVFRVSATAFKVGTSLANVLAGTFVAYSDTGTGTQTATPTALASASLIFQGSYDQTTWFNVPAASVTITADATIATTPVPNLYFPFYAFYATLASGMMTFTTLQVGVKTGG